MKNESKLGQEPILDSRLNIATNKYLYNAKIIDCNGYKELYFYENKRMKKDNSLEPIKSPIEEKTEQEKKKRKIDMKAKQNKNTTLKSVELKNLIRARLKCQFIAKSNIGIWKTFITLTFAENLKEVDKAYKKLKTFIDELRRDFKDLKYLCVPEFQQRGAVHYHLFTNIKIDENGVIYLQDGKTKFKHIKHWNLGFNEVDDITNNEEKVISYISKYMTKNIDDRLFGYNKYYCSRNLKRPTTSFIDLDTEKGREFLGKKIQGKDLIYQSEFDNPYDKTKIKFLEYK